MQGLFPHLRCTSHAGHCDKTELSAAPLTSDDLAAQFAVSSWRELPLAYSVLLLFRF
jgi:hypothetical protein